MTCSDGPTLHSTLFIFCDWRLLHFCSFCKESLLLFRRLLSQRFPCMDSRSSHWAWKEAFSLETEWKPFASHGLH